MSCFYFYSGCLFCDGAEFSKRVPGSPDPGSTAYRDDEEGRFSLLSLNFLFFNLMNRVSGFKQKSSSIKILPEELIGETSCR